MRRYWCQAARCKLRPSECSAFVHRIMSNRYKRVNLQLRPMRPKHLATLTRRHKSVSRTYGGVLCAAAVKERITRAFLLEEAKIVNKVQKVKQQVKHQKKK